MFSPYAPAENSQEEFEASTYAPASPASSMDMEKMIMDNLGIDPNDPQNFVEFLEDSLIDFLKMTLGEGIFQSSGYHQYAVQTGVHGSGEIHPKLRICLVNGILNFPESHRPL